MDDPTDVSQKKPGGSKSARMVQLASKSSRRGLKKKKKPASSTPILDYLKTFWEEDTFQNEVENKAIEELITSAFHAFLAQAITEMQKIANHSKQITSQSLQNNNQKITTAHFETWCRLTHFKVNPISLAYENKPPEEIKSLVLKHVRPDYLNSTSQASLKTNILRSFTTLVWTKQKDNQTILNRIRAIDFLMSLEPKETVNLSDIQNFVQSQHSEGANQISEDQLRHYLNGRLSKHTQLLREKVIRLYNENMARIWHNNPDNRNIPSEAWKALKFPSKFFQVYENLCTLLKKDLCDFLFVHVDNWFQDFQPDSNYLAELNTFVDLIKNLSLHSTLLDNKVLRLTELKNRIYEARNASRKSGFDALPPLTLMDVILA